MHHNFGKLSYSIPLLSVSVLLLVLGISLGFFTAPVDTVQALTSTQADESTGQVPASLIIGGDDLDQVVDAMNGSVAYRSHTVSVNAADLKSYKLVINGPTGLDGGSEISGANNKTPSEMSENSWGYAYGQDGNKSEMIYVSFSNTTQTIDTGVNAEENFTKKLVFAAKFGNSAVSGHYTGTVLLSLTAEPKDLVVPPSESWEESEYMQQMTPEACTSVAIGTSKQLIDIRDNTPYTITRMSDGRCWMTSNLRLTAEGIEKNGRSTKLTSGDSDVDSDGYLMPTSSSEAWSTTSASDAKIYYADNTQNGAYYSWCAATAGKCTGTTANGGQVSTSICPKGWRLPVSYEYSVFLSSTGISTLETASQKFSRIKTSPYNFVAAGYVDAGRIQSANTIGQYWTNTSMSASEAYILGISSSDVNTTTKSRYMGNAIRCVARDDRQLIDIDTMQEMTPQVCANTPMFTPVTLRDTRDGSEYTVAKLTGGKCWMTRNLRIIDKELSSADSNVGSTKYTVPESSLTGFNSGTKSFAYYSGDINIGTYYSWCAATADSCAEANTQNATAAYSVCPKNWRLPTRGEYEILHGNLGDWDATKNGRDVGGAFFPAAGYARSGKINSDNLLGYYWTGTAYAVSGTSAYYFGFGSGSGSGAASTYNHNIGIADGASVRCVAQ